MVLTLTRVIMRNTKLYYCHTLHFWSIACNKYLMCCLSNEITIDPANVWHFAAHRGPCNLLKSINLNTKVSTIWWVWMIFNGFLLYQCNLNSIVLWHLNLLRIVALRIRLNKLRNVENNNLIFFLEYTALMDKFT